MNDQESGDTDDDIFEYRVGDNEDITLEGFEEESTKIRLTQRGPQHQGDAWTCFPETLDPRSMIKLNF